MTDPNVPDWSTDPDDYTVQFTRARAGRGPLLDVAIVSKATPTLLLASYGPDDLDSLLERARDEERFDPHAGRIPSDRAIISAVLRKFDMLGEDKES